jgi:hypothetical protein
LADGSDPFLPLNSSDHKSFRVFFDAASATGFTKRLKATVIAKIPLTGTTHLTRMFEPLRYTTFTKNALVPCGGSGLNSVP